MQSATSCVADALDLGEQRILQRHAKRADDQQRLQAPARGERKERRPQHEAAGDDRRLRQERRGNRHAGVQQEHHEEDAAGALGQGLDAGMQIDAVDRVIAQKCHENTDEEGMRMGRPAAGRPAAAVTL